MDLFKENREVFKKWALIHTSEYEGVTYSLKDDETIVFRYGDKSATLIMRESEMNEEWVNDRFGDMHFYLHYEFKHYPLATKFYYAMMNELTKKVPPFKQRILLCCSGGLTSSYFKMKMNNFLNIAKAPYTVDAAAISDVSSIASNYDVILVAPQMRYMLDELNVMNQECVVEAIEPSVFATYDCAKLYRQIENIYRGNK